MTLDLKVNKDKVKNAENVLSTDAGKKKKTTAEYVEQASKKYNGKYSYEKTVYEGSTKRIIVTCPEHGDFVVFAGGHLNQGRGCKYCGTKRVSEEEFIERAREVHGHKYGYGNLGYSHMSKKVKIKCGIHGEFEQTPKNHLKGHGCNACGEASTAHKLTKTNKEFIEQAKKTHGNKYDYTKTEYTTKSDKVVIICPEHGEFTQEANAHLRGHGCRKCQSENAAKNTWSYSDWEKAGNASPNFEGFSLYVIKCVGNGEEFIKVGKTYVGTAKRFCSATAMPYKYKVITQVYHNAYAISKLEDKIKRKLKEYKYKPEREFAGMYECFTVEALEKAVKIAES